MSVLISANIKGLNNPVLVHSEYTNSEILNRWADQDDGFFVTLNRVFARGKTLVRDNTGTIVRVDEDPVTTQDAIDLQEDLQRILQLAQTGVQVDGKTFYLTYEMATALDKIMKTLDAVGFNLNANLSDTAQVEANRQALGRWADLDDVGLREIVVQAGNAVSNSRSLQAMIELEYVKVGNQLIGDQLEQLDTALNATKDALFWLEKAQLLKNNLTPESRQSDASFYARIFAEAGNTPGGRESEGYFTEIARGEGSFSQFTRFFTTTGGGQISAPGGRTGPGTFEAFFKRALEDIFNEPLGVSPDDVAQNLAEFNEVRNGLAAVRARLQEVGGGEITEGTLADKIGIMLQQINDIGNTDEERFTNWIVDFYDAKEFTQSGDQQRTLTETITAATSLNDRQKEDLRRFLFVFEQFYKSASAMLQAIDRMTNKMASNIKG